MEDGDGREEGKKNQERRKGGRQVRNKEGSEGRGGKRKRKWRK